MLHSLSFPTFDRVWCLLWSKMDVTPIGMKRYTPKKKGGFLDGGLTALSRALQTFDFNSEGWHIWQPRVTWRSYMKECVSAAFMWVNLLLHCESFLHLCSEFWIHPLRATCVSLISFAASARDNWIRCQILVFCMPCRIIVPFFCGCALSRTHGVVVIPLTAICNSFLMVAWKRIFCNSVLVHERKQSWIW